MFRRLPKSHEEGQALRGVLANERAVKAYKREMGEAGGSSEEEGEESQDKKEQEEELLGDVDECPICFEAIDAKHKRAELAVCVACHRPAGHKVCFNHWKTSRRRDGQRVNCVWCRAEWVEEEAAGGGGKAGGGAAGVKRDGAYINLGAYTGQTARRDTSTYSEWGARRRYGYGGWRHVDDDDGDY